MKKQICPVIGLLFGLLFLSPLPASAEIIESWGPAEWDYGDVVVGAAESQIFSFTISNDGPVWVDDITLVTDPYNDPPPPYTGSSFTIMPNPPIGYNPISTTFTIAVTFSPTSVGRHEAFLRVESDESSGYHDLRIPLSGMGVAAEPDPAAEMAELIEFYEDSVADGTIVGYGPGNSARGRLKAFGNMLKSSSDLISAGAYDLACSQIQDALNRTDGLFPPPDFVTGANKEELATSIIEVMNALGCP
jgi:hypothetical protein